MASKKKKNYIGERYAILPPFGTFDVQSERVGPWWDWVGGYYESPCWKEKCRLLLAAAKGKCAHCTERPPTDAHHLTYVRVGHEFWEDLEAVCTPCHHVIHGRTW